MSAQVPRVVLVPRNGYVNRLQALVSSQLVAQGLGAPLQVLWEPQPAAPDDVSRILDTGSGQIELLEPGSALPGGLALQDIPVGLTRGPEETLFLAGGLTGEQYFMPQLRSELMKPTKSVVIVAGGKFWLPGSSELTGEEADAFRAARRDMYQNLKLHTSIEDRAHQIARKLPARFVGLHLRYSDRNFQAPMKRSVRKAMREMGPSVDWNVYVAGDSRGTVEKWRTWLEQNGWRVWVDDSTESSPNDGRSSAALVDWRVLGAAHRRVYFSASSFGEEAAVASGRFEESIGLQTSHVRAVFAQGTYHVQNALSYPSRHWLNSKPQRR